MSPGLEPHENAQILERLLQNKLPKNDPILTFVLINAAALFVVAGVCDADVDSLDPSATVIKEVGPGEGRWKEGVRRARWAVESGAAWEQWKAYVAATNGT